MDTGGFLSESKDCKPPVYLLLELEDKDGCQSARPVEEQVRRLPEAAQPQGPALGLLGCVFIPDISFNTRSFLFIFASAVHDFLLQGLLWAASPSPEPFLVP